MELQVKPPGQIDFPGTGSQFMLDNQLLVHVKFGTFHRSHSHTKLYRPTVPGSSKCYGGDDQMGSVVKASCR